MITVDEVSPYVLTPKSRVCRPERIKYKEAAVKVDEQKPDRFTLTYQQGGKQPFLILDLGRSSPGGYPVFTVKSYKGSPVLRLAYSDWYPYLLDEQHRCTGDFTRGCCKYLGVELPVLPGNPNRYELYTIQRTGKFLYPLIQGQQRFVLVTLDSPGEVEIDGFYIYYTGNMDAYDGLFSCSEKALNQLWYSSTYTVQIASVDSTQSWDVIEGYVLLRALTKGNPAGIYVPGLQWEDYTFTFDGQIAVNPHCYSGIGWMVRARDADNGYVFQLSLDGRLRWFLRKNGVNTLVEEGTVPFPVVDNVNYTISTQVTGNHLVVSINGAVVFACEDSTFAKGSVGFIQTTEKWAMATRLMVSSGDKVLLQDDFADGISDDYDFTRSLPFLADGAKRDRLPWIGDLDWAGRNVYYAFRNDRYMRGSLEMFAQHQTPDGYIWGVCYPENKDPVRSGEYGHYESDIFSAWFVPTLWDFLLFTGDGKQASALLETAVKDLEYLWSYVDDNGLFFQRYATSKGLWDHELKDIGYFSYNNIIVYDALRKGAFLAKECHRDALSEQLRHRSALMKEGILKWLWNEEKGYFSKGLSEPEFCYMANCLALAVGILSDEQAQKAVQQLQQWFPHNLVYGKIVSLFIRGCFRYGLDDIAYKTLTGKTGLSYEGDTPVHVDWLSSIMDDNGPATTTECMLYPPAPETSGEQWLDRSHPDTAVAHLLSGYLLGVQPLTCGFETFLVQPHCCELKAAKGVVPTPFGKIEVEWTLEDGEFVMTVNHPHGVTPIFSLQFVHSQTQKITVNGQRIESSALCENRQNPQ